MKTEAWIDKSWWGEGPWQDEPDRIEWRDETTGLPCLMLRHPLSGHWCGYVAVPPGHSLHGLNYDDEPVVRSDVSHGGFTYAGPCADDERDQRERICHVPEPGEPGDVWWFGFDCAHYGDRCPALRIEADGIYRDAPYVRSRCALVAAAFVESPISSRA